RSFAPARSRSGSEAVAASWPARSSFRAATSPRPGPPWPRGPPWGRGSTSRSTWVRTGLSRPRPARSCRSDTRPSERPPQRAPSSIRASSRPSGGSSPSVRRTGSEESMRFAAKDRSAVGQSRGTRMSMSASPSVPNASSEAAISAEDLFRLHAPFVARFLFRLGVGPDAIDDAVQEVFLVVHRQGGYRPGAARATSYLANLALHAASAHRRAQRRRRDRETDAAVEDVAAPASGPVEVLETNESLRRLQGLLGCLDPDLRSTL